MVSEAPSIPISFWVYLLIVLTKLSRRLFSSKLSNITPIAITPYGRARYIVPGTGKTAAGGTECKFNIRVQTLTTEIFDILASGETSPRTIPTDVIVTGQQSGMNVKIPVTIQEYV